MDQNTRFIKAINATRELVKPKGIMQNSKGPNLVKKVVLGMFNSLIIINDI